MKTSTKLDMKGYIVFKKNCKHLTIYKEHLTLENTLNAVILLHRNQSNRICFKDVYNKIISNYQYISKKKYKK